MNDVKYQVSDKKPEQTKADLSDTLDRLSSRETHNSFKPIHCQTKTKHDRLSEAGQNGRVFV
ncbi:MAG: hypothetical protein IJ325_09810 [Clostridia bacterium]|nr:hypothetical protein [Clostridia bacterium]